MSPYTPSGSPAAPEASPPPPPRQAQAQRYPPTAHTIIPPVWEHVIVVIMKMPHLLLRYRT